MTSLTPEPTPTEGETVDVCPERGAGLVEYALLVALIFIVCVAAVTLLGTATSSQISSVSGGLS